MRIEKQLSFLIVKFSSYKQVDVDVYVVMRAEINLAESFLMVGHGRGGFHGGCLLLQRLYRSLLWTRHRSAPAVREEQPGQIVRAPTPFLETCSGCVETKINDCFLSCLVPSTEPQEDQSR